MINKLINTELEKYMGYIKSGSQLHSIDVMERKGLNEAEGRLFFVKYNGEFKLVESFSLYGPNKDDIEIVHQGILLRKRYFSWYIYLDSGKLLDPKYELEQSEIKEIFKNGANSFKSTDVNKPQKHSFYNSDYNYHDYDEDEPKPEPEPDDDYGTDYSVPFNPDLASYPDGLDDFDEIIDYHYIPDNNEYEVNTDDEINDYNQDEYDIDNYGE